MKTTLLICLVGLLGATTYAQNNQTEIKKENNGVIKYIKFTPPINLLRTAK